MRGLKLQKAISLLRNELYVFADPKLEDLWDAARRGVAFANTRRQAHRLMEVDLTYRPSRARTLKFLAGVRMYSVDQTLNIRNLTPAESNTTVVDPIIGAVGVWDLSDAWHFEVRADIGGFGVGSEFTNQLMGLFHWQMTDRLRLPFGYRVLGYQIQSGDVWMNNRMGGVVVGLDIRM